MIICPECNEENESATLTEMINWHQDTVDFTCSFCDCELDMPAEEYVTLMERDKNGC